jgi:hypothetical protein
MLWAGAGCLPGSHHFSGFSTGPGTGPIEFVIRSKKLREGTSPSKISEMVVLFVADYTSATGARRDRKRG